MSDTRTGDDAPATAPPASPSSEPRAARPGARELALRFLTLREGSIIVVTLLTIVYFTIDQQPYLQGFLPVLELYLNKVSTGLSGIGDVNTGLLFLDKTTVVPYNDTKSRYEGTASAAGVAKS